jgi:hypothetical protein
MTRELLRSVEFNQRIYIPLAACEAERARPPVFYLLKQVIITARIGQRCGIGAW